MLTYETTQFTPPPCWILSYPRVGSNYLCGSLNQTKLFHPKVHEWINVRSDQVRDIPDNYTHTRWEPWKTIKNATKTDLMNEMPRNLKVHCFDYRLYFSQEDAKAISEKLPDIKFIRLQRKDLVACAASYYLARETKIFASLKSDVVEHANTTVKLNHERIMECYGWVQNWDTEWDRFVKKTNHLDVFYEDLVSGTSTLKQIFEFLGIPTSMVKRIVPRIQEKKLNHPQTQEIIDVIKETNGRDS